MDEQNEDILLTPEEFENTMAFIADKANKDRERTHMYMDALMEETLIALGYGKGVEIFRNAQKWYA